MKLISVIIPCFNVTEWLPQCFMTLYKQTIGIENIELIFVDDASTDDGLTWEMITDIEKIAPESVIAIHLDKNMRQGGARNIALKYASGKYISFVDADDWVEYEMLEKAYNLAEEFNADIVQFGHRLYVDKFGYIKENDLEKDTNDVIDSIAIDCIEKRKSFLMSEYLTYGCWNKLYKNELIKQSGAKFAEHVIYEEPIFVYPLLFFGKIYVKTSEPLYVYRQNMSGTMHNDMKEMDTLFQHAQVQLMVWDFMKNTEYFQEFHSEIKAYFLHTYLYEILVFAKNRGLQIPFERYLELITTAKQESGSISVDGYEDIFSEQTIIYSMIEKNTIKENWDMIWKK